MHLRSLPALSLALLAALSASPTRAGSDELPSARALASLRRRFPAALGERPAGGAPRVQAHGLSGQGFSLRTDRLALDVVLQGARPEPLVGDRDLLLARGAGPGASDVVLRPSPRGIEDHLVFEAPPASPEVVYEVRLDGVAGLRLVANTLEFLSADGAPRLRIEPPYLLDADQRRHPAALSVEGCAVDTSPAAPWRRPVTAPGAATCAVRVSWADGLRYPALLDPVWQDATSMTLARVAPAMIALPEGDILITGGLVGSVSDASKLTATATAELFDPEQNLFASGASLPEPRWGHSLSAVPGGVLLVGGVPGSGQDAISTAYLLDSSASWTPIASPSVARVFHTATNLNNGRVLLVGGHGGDPLAADPLNKRLQIEIYDPFNKKWNGATALPANQDRYAHTATLLPDGRVLVVGGARAGGATGNSLLFSPIAPSASAWTPIGSSVGARAGHQAILSRGGQVLVAGGCDSAPSFTSCNEPAGLFAFSPSKNTWTALVGAPKQSSADKPAGGRLFLGLPSGWIQASGGRYFDAALSSFSLDFETSTLRPTAGQPPLGDVTSDLATWSWSNLVQEERLPSVRAFHAGIISAKGQAVLVGGINDASSAIGDVSVLSSSCDPSGSNCVPLLANGQPCDEKDPLRCASGVCTEGVCCDQTCSDACSSCRASNTNLKDGVCGIHTAKDKMPCKAAGDVQCVELADKSGFTTDRGVCSGGKCVDAPESCGAYRCENGKGCLSSCELPGASECYDPKNLNWCVDSGSGLACVPKFATGTECPQDEACNSGHCETALSGKVCCVEACAPWGCDSNRAGIIRSVCDGGLGCKADYLFCNGFACDELGPSCLSSCSGDKDCSKTHFCDEPSKQCYPRLDAGQSCKDDGDCKSGSCRDGVCCSETCLGFCSSCNSKLTQAQDGVCKVVTPNVMRAACSPDGNPCGNTGFCKGPNECEQSPKGTQCGAQNDAKCGGQTLLTSICDGKGGCAPGELSCAPYQCRGQSCSVSCQGDADCAPNARCVGEGNGSSGKCAELKQTGCSTGGLAEYQACAGQCETVALPCLDGSLCEGNACKGFCANDGGCRSDHLCIAGVCKPKQSCAEGLDLVISNEGSKTPCKPGQRCIASEPGRCLSDCTSSLDCVDGLVCGSDGNCRAPLAAADTTDIDCYCAAPGRPASASGGVALAALAALALRLRARRARCGT